MCPRGHLLGQHLNRLGIMGSLDTFCFIIKSRILQDLVFVFVKKHKVIFRVSVPYSKISSILRRQTEVQSSRPLCAVHYWVGFVEEDNLEGEVDIRPSGALVSP